MERALSVEFRVSLVLAGGFGRLGCWGRGCPGRGESWVGASVSGLASGDLHSRFRRGVWTVDFSVTALGLVFLALIWFGLGDLDLWVWVGLGWSGLAWASFVMGGL